MRPATARRPLIRQPGDFSQTARSVLVHEPKLLLWSAYVTMALGLAAVLAWLAYGWLRFGSSAFHAG